MEKWGPHWAPLPRLPHLTLNGTKGVGEAWQQAHEALEVAGEGAWGQERGTFRRRMVVSRLSEPAPHPEAPQPPRDLAS